MAVPEIIQQKANDIRTKVYGREVRESLASGLEVAGDIADQANTKSEYASDKVDNIQSQVDQLVVEGDSSVEAAQARVDADGNAYTTLKERLDTEHTEVTAQLAQIAEPLSKFGNLTDGMDISDILETALNTGKEITVSGNYTVSRRLKPTTDWKLKGNKAKLTVTSVLDRLVETSHRVILSGELEIDGANNITSDLIYNQNKIFPEFEGVTFRNIGTIYRTNEIGEISPNEQGYLRRVKHFNCGGASEVYCYFLYGQNKFGLYFNGDMLFDHCFWDDQCEGHFFVGWSKSVKVKNCILLGKGANAENGFNCYVVNKVEYLDSTFDGVFRGPTIGKYTKNVTISRNTIRNTKFYPISLDARIGHNDTNAFEPNILGEWDVSTGVPPDFPNAIERDAVRVSVGGEYTTPTGFVYEFRKGDLVFYNPNSTTEGMHWYVDFPSINALIENNFVDKAGDRIYVQGSDVTFKNNNFNDVSFRINGAQRIKIYDNPQYASKEVTGQAYVQTHTGADVQVYNNPVLGHSTDRISDMVQSLDSVSKIKVGNITTVEATEYDDIQLTWYDENIVCNHTSLNVLLRLPAETSEQNIQKIYHIYNISDNNVLLATQRGRGTINGSGDTVEVPPKSKISLVRFGVDNWITI